MQEQPFTLAWYRVQPGSEDKFIGAWNELAETFVSLPDPPLWGTLIRSSSEPGLFYSFGPWRDPAHVAAMRANGSVQAAFARIGALCVDMHPDDFHVVHHVQGAGERAAGDPFIV